MFSNCLRRSLSLSSVAQQLIKPPIHVAGIPGRYATALYSAASKQKKLDVIEKELQDIESLYKSDGNFRDFVKDPTLKKSYKKGTIDAITKTMNQSQISQSFFGLLAENGQLPKLEAILNTFHQVMGAHRGEVTCEVVTAKPMDPPMQKELDAVLKSFIKAGQKVNITTKVDPSIVGGMTVTIGDKYVDLSLASKLRMYEKVLQEAA